MEINNEIHGEPCILRTDIAPAKDIATQLTEKILEDMSLEKGDEVVVMVNGLGATPEMELFIVNKTVQEMLKDRGINVHKTFVGEYMIALEMGGCSVTLLKVDEELKYLLVVESDAPNFFFIYVENVL